MDVFIKDLEEAIENIHADNNIKDMKEKESMIKTLREIIQEYREYIEIIDQAYSQEKN